MRDYALFFSENEHIITCILLDFYELQKLFCMLEYTQRADIKIDNALTAFGCDVPARIQKPEKQSQGLSMLQNGMWT